MNETKSDLQAGPGHDEPVRSNKFADYVAAVIVSIIFSYFLVFGFFSDLEVAQRVLRNRSLVESGVKVYGTVVGYAVGEGRGKGYAPVVSFVTADGRTMQFESLHRPNYTGHVPGEAVPVLYDPQDPSIAEINKPERLWGGVALGFAVATLFLIFGGGGLILLVRAILGHRRLHKEPSSSNGCSS